MNTFTETLPRVQGPTGSFTPAVTRTEWTPRFALMPSRSLWPNNPTTGPLTDAKIMARAREGWYGKHWQRVAKAHELKLSLRRVKSGELRAQKCCEVGCTVEAGVKFVHYNYLPKAGWYCPLHIELHRAERDKDKGLKKRWLELMKKEYV